MNRVITPHPMNYGQPACWLDAGDIHERILNGSNVSSALDKSGNHRDFSQATTIYQPLLNVGGLGGQDTWRGVGSNDRLTGNIPLTAETTIVIVCDRLPTYLGSYIIAGNGTSGSPAILCNFKPGSDAVAFEQWEGGFGRWTFSENAIGANVLAITHDDHASGNNNIGYFNGSQVFAVSNSANWAGRSVISLFTDDIFASFYQGNIAEFVLYHRILRADEIYTLTRYYANKRGLSI